MATTGTTALSNLMRQSLNPKVLQAFVNDPILLMLLDNALDPKKVNNKGEDITVRTAPSPSFGALGESALLPVAGSPVYSKMNVTNKLHYAQGEISGLAWLMQDVDTIGRGRVRQVAGMLGELIEGETGNMIHSTVPPGQVNRATIHATVSEFWHVLSGEGQLWRRDGTGEETTVLGRGVSTGPGSGAGAGRPR